MKKKQERHESGRTNEPKRQNLKANAKRFQESASTGRAVRASAQKKARAIKEKKEKGIGY